MIQNMGTMNCVPGGGEIAHCGQISYFAES